MSNKKLLKKLKNADVTCFDCGHKYGVYSVGCSSVWEGKCDVCGETKPITETRDFAYFVTGIRKLLKEIEDEKGNS
jgi:ribosomal protein S27E